MRSVAWLITRSQLTRGRAIAMGAVVALGVLIAVAIGSTKPFEVKNAYDFVDGFGIGLVVPVVALVFASAALGDPAEDGTLVYLWLRPIARWRISVAAFVAALLVAAPFAVLATALMAALAGRQTNLVVAAAAASALGTLAYSSLFLGLGLLVRRALAWGLAYVLIWEGFVARSGTAAARLSVLYYARSALAHGAGQLPPPLAPAVPAAVVVPLVVTACGVALTAAALRRIDVK